MTRPWNTDGAGGLLWTSPAGRHYLVRNNEPWCAYETTIPGGMAMRIVGDYRTRKLAMDACEADQ